MPEPFDPKDMVSVAPHFAQVNLNAGIGGLPGSLIVVLSNTLSAIDIFSSPLSYSS